jgi:hypothetical protein
MTENQKESSMSEDGKIKFELRPAGSFTRRCCHICGGYTEKVGTTIEVVDGPHAGLRACEACLQHGDIDARLREHVDSLENRVTGLRTLMGRLQVPTYGEWCAFEDRLEVASWAADSIRREDGHDNSPFPGTTAEAAEAAYKSVMSDYRAYKWWKKRLAQAVHHQASIYRGQDALDLDQQIPF